MLSTSATTVTITTPAGVHVETLSLPTDDKGFVSEGDRDIVFRRLRAKLENRQCFDCHNRNPTWLSMTYAVFLCLSCSGNHRRLGTHISFVRSCELDKFTPQQLLRMELGGNGKAVMFFRTHGSTKPEYHSKLASKYKAELDKSCQLISTIPGGASAESLPLKGAEPWTDPTSVINRQQTTELSTSSNLSSTQGEFQSSVPATPTVAMILPQPELPPPIYKASGVPRAAPQYDDPQHRTGSGGLGSALMAHASATGGITSTRNIKAKKLDFDFDFDEALQQAKSAPPSAERIQPVYQPVTVVTPPSVVNNYSASFDATVGLNTTGLQPFKPASSSLSTNGAVASNTKYAKAKAISSDDLFGGGPNPQTPAERLELDSRVRRFNDCKGISSDAFHAGDPTWIKTGKTSFEDDLSTTQMTQLSEQARQGIQTLASAGKETVSKARDWINNFIFEERPSSGGMFR